MVHEATISLLLPSNPVVDVTRKSPAGTLISTVPAASNVCGNFMSTLEPSTVMSLMSMGKLASSAPPWEVNAT